MACKRAARVVAALALWAGLPFHAAHAQSPECQIAVLAASGSDPLQVLFDANTAGGDPPLAFHWDFGDGATSNLKSPFHEYSGTGEYFCVLTVTPNGMPGAACRDTAIMDVGVFADPVCWAAVNDTWAEAPLPLLFSAGPAFAPEPPYTWIWNFGDGTTRTIQTNDALLPPIEHGYAVPGTYWAAVALKTEFGTYTCHPTLRITTLVPQAPVAVDPPGAADGFAIEPARPNPFGFATTLGYALPRAGRVRLVILDLQGRRIATLADGVRGAGRHVTVWQGRSDAGAVTPAGVYVAVLEQDGARASTRIVRAP